MNQPNFQLYHRQLLLIVGQVLAQPLNSLVEIHSDDLCVLSSYISHVEPPV